MGLCDYILFVDAVRVPVGVRAAFFSGVGGPRRSR